MGLIGAEIEGFDLIIKNLQDATEEVKRKANDLIQECGINIEADAKIACPVDNGRLRGSIKYTPGDMECSVFTNVEYAAYVEFGTGIYAKDGNGRSSPWVYMNAETKEFVYTHGNKPQPFLFPAFENNGHKLIDALRDI